MISQDFSLAGHDIEAAHQSGVVLEGDRRMRILKAVYHLLVRAEGIFFALEERTRLAERFLYRYFNWRFRKAWWGGEPPHWFEHRIDLFTWPVHRNAHWVERGVYSLEAMWSECRVLDLGCGDGFYPYHFYTAIASHIDALDVEPEAISYARKYHSHPKIRYHVLDAIAQEFPAPHYDVICWDGGLGHFSRAEVDIVMGKIRAALGDSGVLTGYEMIEPEGEPSWNHKIALGTVENLQRLLQEYFECVGMLETFSPGRHNAYFRCSADRTRLGRFG